MLVAAWNVYELRSSGPRLELVVHDRPPMFPPESRPPGEIQVLVVECRNHGRGPATIHDFWLRGSDGESWARCQLEPCSAPIQTIVSGRSMVKWIIDRDTLASIPLPRRADGMLALSPAISWGAGEVLSGELAEFYVPQGWHECPGCFLVAESGNRHAQWLRVITHVGTEGVAEPQQAIAYGATPVRRSRHASKRPRRGD